MKQQIAIEFLQNFCRNDLESLTHLLTEDFKLTGPFYQFNSRRAYLSHLEQDPPQNSSFNIIKIFADDEAVCLFYEYFKPQGSTIIAQLYKFRGNQIAEILLVFDGSQLS
jgi:hypothetical protein